MGRFWPAVGGLTVLLMAGNPRADMADLELAPWEERQPGAVIADARPLEMCLQASVADAICLPAQDLFGPDGNLASFRDILWRLGTHGLTGAETVAVIGENMGQKTVLAAILFLSGQSRVEIITGPMPASDGAGRGPAMVRETVFQAPMRDDLIVLPHEPSPPNAVKAETVADALTRFAETTARGERAPVFLAPAAAAGGLSLGWLGIPAVVVLAIVVLWRREKLSWTS